MKKYLLLIIFITSSFIAANNFNTAKINYKIDLGIGDKDFVLHQNYPNPFNPTTVIKYSIPQQTFVSLKVYNILGKEVSVLVNEQKEAGVYEVEFNASNLSNGIYFYTLRAGNFVDTKKLILAK